VVPGTSILSGKVTVVRLSHALADAGDAVAARIATQPAVIANLWMQFIFMLLLGDIFSLPP
jgi:hypothetical protein